MTHTRKSSLKPFSFNEYAISPTHSNVYFEAWIQSVPLKTILRRTPTLLRFLALVEGDKWNRGDRGQGAWESRGQERDLFEGGKREQMLKKHTRILFITVSHPVLRPVPI